MPWTEIEKKNVASGIVTVDPCRRPNNSESYLPGPDQALQTKIGTFSFSEKQIVDTHHHESVT